jgi:type IV pilus assembly protein PilE
MARARATGARAGFTLIELLVVVSVIAILAAIAFPAFATRQGRAYDAQVAQDARNAATGQEAYFADTLGYYTGDCTNLPGVVLSDDMSCQTTALDARSFEITTSHPKANVSCVWSTSTSPNLICS